MYVRAYKMPKRRIIFIIRVVENICLFISNTLRRSLIEDHTLKNDLNRKCSSEQKEREIHKELLVASR